LGYNRDTLFGEETLRKSERGITFKAILIGTILIPIHAYWVFYLESIRGGAYPTCVSLFYNVVFCIFILILLNFLLNKLSAKLVLNEGELLIIYAMLCMVTALTGHDIVQVLGPAISHGFWFATPENEWAELFHSYIPPWLSLSDKSILEDYYKGESTLYMAERLRGWLKPVLWWSAFLFALLLVMNCINVIIRKQWTEQERLSYPITQLPLAMMRDANVSNFLRQRLMWIGFAIAAGISILNGLNALYPTIPALRTKTYDLRPFFTEKPWNAIGWTPISLYPFVIGLSFFIPLDLSFSSWFFYLFWKAERIFGAMIGLRGLPRFPYVNEQSFGAYIGIFIFGIWTSRKHLEKVFRQVFTLQKKENDSEESKQYRAATVGIFLGMVFLIGFCYRGGMPFWVILLSFLIYYAVSIAITRMRAELGSPVHDLHFSGPERIMPMIFGSRFFNGSTLTMFAFFNGFNRAYRGHPMPHQLESLKMAERMKISGVGVSLAIIFASAFGALAAFWAMLHIAYRVGATNSAIRWFGQEAFNRLQNLMNNPTSTDYQGLSFISIGLLFSFFLMTMRRRFIWWSFHPAGYAVSGSWQMNTVWFPILLSWLVKTIILKYGGLKAHRRAIPFFLGLILGEFVVGSIWMILELATGVRMYSFWI